MTAIAYRDGIMCADTVAWVADQIKIPVGPKIIRVPTGLIGFCGRGADALRFEVWARDGQPEGQRPAFDRNDGFSAIWARHNGRAAICAWDCRWDELQGPFHAIGAATVFCMGAMFAGATAEQAVWLAIEHTDSAGGRVQVEHLLLAG